MLTAAGETEDRILGLNEGADDYLSKPFSWEELEARIRALSRRRVAIPVRTLFPDANKKTEATSGWEVEMSLV